MDVALKMCRILNDKGEFTDDLTIQPKDDWIVPHCSLKANENDKTSAQKIGSTKNKREYKFKVSISVITKKKFTLLFEFSPVCRRVGKQSSENR